MLLVSLKLGDENYQHLKESLNYDNYHRNANSQDNFVVISCDVGTAQVIQLCCSLGQIDIL